MSFNEHRVWSENLGPADGDPVVVAAGDIAEDGGGMSETAKLISRIPDALVIALGDNAYPDGTPDDFRDHYTPFWGPFQDRLWT